MINRPGIRETFIDTGRVAAALLAAPEIAARWDEPSALEEFSVRGLAGHLLRATGSVVAYLGRPEPGGDPVSAAEYYLIAVDETDVHSELHRAIRKRGEETAAGGYEALVADSRTMLEQLESILRVEPTGRKVRAYKDLVLRLDDYLVTRLIELVVHIDDLAVSVGIPVPEMPADATRLAIETLVEVARLKHGDVAVMRGLTRRERDAVQALRVL